MKKFTKANQERVFILKGFSKSVNMWSLLEEKIYTFPWEDIPDLKSEI